MNNPSAFPLGEPNDGFAQYFDGQSWLAPVLDAPEVSIHNVTFEPGCRNHWHIHHHAAQILIAVGGRGYYQLEGEEPKELEPGQAVFRRMLSIGTAPPLTKLSAIWRS